MQERISDLPLSSDHCNPNSPHAVRRRERVAKLTQDLRTGRKVTDHRFDLVYPPTIRKLSETHWTPVEVAVRAAEILVSDDRTRVLDVGSGCGKFCTVAALASPGQFTGIEQRPHLVEIARSLSFELGVKRSTFLEGNMADLDWNDFDAFYLFNPFYENTMRSIRIDDTVSLNQEKYFRYVEIVRRKLRSAPFSTRVVTYHGFGGEMPFGYARVRREPIGSSYLELWMKTESPTPRFLLR